MKQNKFIAFITTFSFLFITLFSPFVDLQRAQAQNIGSLRVITASGFSFKKDLILGDTDPDVLQLQKVLNSDIDTLITTDGPGSPNKETSYFGTLTKLAVIKFQNKYKDIVLTLNGIKVADGVVNKATRTRLNLLLGVVNTYDSVGQPQSRASTATVATAPITYTAPVTVVNTTSQASMPVCQFVELLIGIGAVNSSRINQARSGMGCSTNVTGTAYVDLEIDNQDTSVTINSGDSITLSWTSANVTKCASDSSYSTKKATHGTKRVSNVTSSGTYEIYCEDLNGDDVYDSVDVYVVSTATSTSPISTSTLPIISTSTLPIATSSPWNITTPISSNPYNNIGNFGMGGNLPSITSSADTPNIIGYGQANYWMDTDPFVLATQLSINLLPVTYIELLGDARLGAIGTLASSTASSTSNTIASSSNSFNAFISQITTGYGSPATSTNYYNNPKGIQTKAVDFVRAMRNSGITTIINLVDWKYPTICEPQYDDSWFNTSLDFVIKQIGTQKVILQVGSDSSGLCSAKAQRWNNLMSSKWSGLKSWNQGSNPVTAPSTKWFLENHPCSITSFGNPGSDVVTKCPYLLSQLSASGNILGGVDKQILTTYVTNVRSTNDKGFVYYNPNPTIDNEAISALGAIALASSTATTTPVEPAAPVTQFGGTVKSVSSCTPINDIGHTLWQVTIGPCKAGDITTSGLGGMASGDGYIVIRDGFQTVPKVGETVLGGAVHDGAAECTNASSGSGPYIGVVSGPMGVGSDCGTTTIKVSGGGTSDYTIMGRIQGALAGYLVGATTGMAAGCTVGLLGGPVTCVVGGLAGGLIGGVTGAVGGAIGGKKVVSKIKKLNPW